MKTNIITFDQIHRDNKWISQHGGIYRTDQIISKISRTGIAFSGIQFINFNQLSIDSALFDLCQLIDNEYQEFWDDFMLLKIALFEWPGETTRLMIFQKWLCKKDLEKVDMDKWESEGMFLNYGGTDSPTYVFRDAPSKNHICAYTLM